MNEAQHPGFAAGCDDLARELDVRGAMVVGGIVVGVAIFFISRWWTRIYVAELRGEL